MKRTGEIRHETSFQEMKRSVFLQDQSCLSLFVNFEKNKNLHSISQIDYCDVISYLEHFGMVPL